MTQSARRIARYRDPKHPRRDSLDRLVGAAMVVTVAVVNVTAIIPVLTVLQPLHYGSFLMATLALVCAALNLVIMRGVSVLGQHVIRRWIFDHEQRRHEIVPYTERRKTRA